MTALSEGLRRLRDLGAIHVVAVSLLASPADAQSPVPLGERVRITSLGTHTGRVQRIDADSIVIAPDRSLTFRAFALPEVERLEIDAGPARSPGRGMLIGAAVGAALGAAAGQFVGECEPQGPGDYCPSFAAYSAGGGVVVGALVGLLWAGGTRWEPVALPANTVTFTPRVTRAGAGLSMRLAVGS